MMKEILDLAVRSDAKQALAAIEMFQGRLRELGELPELPIDIKAGLMSVDEFNKNWLAEPMGECPTCHGEVGHRVNCPEGIAFSRHAPPIPTCRDEPTTDNPRAAQFKRTEVQDGLEEAVRRAREDVDAHD